MTKKYRTHPSTILDRIYKRLFLLLFPIVRALFFVITNQKGDDSLKRWFSGAWFDIAVLAVIVVIAFLEWIQKYYSFTEEGIMISSGLFIKQEIFIPKQMVSSLTVSTPLHLRMVKAKRFNIETDSGIGPGTDASFILSEKEAEKIFKAHDTEGSSFLRKVYRPMWYEIAFLSVCVTNLLGTSVYMIILLRQAGKIFARDILLDLRIRFQSDLSSLSYIPKTAVLVAFLILLLYAVSFLNNYIYYAGFYIKRESKVLVIKRGAIVSSRSICKIESINYVERRQNLLANIARLNMIFFQAAGHGIMSSKPEPLIPVISTGDATRYLRILLPEFRECPLKIRPGARAVGVYMMGPLIVVAVLLTATIGLGGIILPALGFQVWQEFVVFVGVMMILPFVVMILLRIISVKKAGVGCEENRVTVCYFKNFFIRTLTFPKEKINYVRIRQTVFQKRKNLCTLFIYTYSERGDKHKIRQLPYSSTKEYLSEHLQGYFAK